jgi:isoleucyl-tRNA synthetase
VIFLATSQWFIRLDGEPVIGGGLSAEGSGLKTLREAAIDAIDNKVRWIPSWGHDRMYNMVAHRPDWCISRQRVWGVPIAVFTCTGCKKPLKDPAVNKKVVDLFATSGADAWYTPQADALANGAKCPHCGGTSFNKEADILDVWFESGCSYLVEVSNEANYPWPSDLYLEGGDQYRGWFMSSLLCALGAKGSAPYKSCATPGWTLDEQGRAMSKSRGNDVDPADIANRLGGEIVRLWVASVDFREDVVGSESLMQRIAETYRNIRNVAFKNSLGNLYDFAADKAVAFEQMPAIDQYFLRLTCALSADVIRWYEEFAFHKIYQRVNHFCTVELSAFYADIAKDRLYIFAPNSIGRRSAQTVLWRFCEGLTRLLAPIMSFTCDEVWQYLSPIQQRSESVHLANFPTPADILGNSTISAEDPHQQQEWATLRNIRDQVLKALEEARNQKQIGKSLEAQVKLTASDALYPTLERHKVELRYLFIVSAVTVERSSSGNGTGGLTVEVSKAAGEKCERCWNYSVHVGEDQQYPTVCERCAAVLKELEPGDKGPASK